MNRKHTTPYFRSLVQRIESLGGLHNAHLHIDRAGTYERTVLLMEGDADSSGSHLSLAKKHALIPLVHASSCYDPDQLEQRVDGFVEAMVTLGTSRADTLVDVTLDRVQFSALDRLNRIKARHRGALDFRVGAYSPLGFRDDEPGRWRLLEDAALQADFLGALPERDDQTNYPEHIGFVESCRRILLLSSRLDKELHIHVDQQNHDREDATETILRLIREMGLAQPQERDPRVWLVHVISPSAYGEPRFAKLVEELAALNVGVICCPSAAISMRQLRPILSPTRNSMARVLEMLSAGVHVRVGSDNICDITSPAGTLDLVDELFVLANAVRYYHPEILAKLGAGLRLNERERAALSTHLAEDRQEVERALSRYRKMNTA